MNKYLILIFFGLCLLSCQTHKKSIHETTINELITINSLRANMEFLSSDELEDYHRVTDDLDKINYLKIQKIARLVYAIALSAANRESQFKLDD